MPKWECNVTVVNRLDRDLELISKSIPWGKETAFPILIKKGGRGTYSVYAPAATMTGIEFYATLQDKVPDENGVNYGLVEIRVDMPYWKSKNTTSCNASGILEVKNFVPAAEKARDYSTTVTVSKIQP